ncbi:metal-dependent hydrolase [Chloroflexota bacterium]
MLFFGHIGITAGVAKAFEILETVTKPNNSHESDSSLKFGTVIGRGRLRLHYLLNRIKGRLGSIDYRMILPGSLLPDIIDKPVWFFVTSLTSDTSLSGRDYVHTLLLNLGLLTGGLVLIRYKTSWLLIISLSSFMHLIFDQIWNSPMVLLWPLLGPLPKEETVGWLSNVLQGLFLYPAVYVPEIIGLLVILLFASRLVMRKNVTSFLKGGAIA